MENVEARQAPSALAFGKACEAHGADVCQVAAQLPGAAKRLDGAGETGQVARRRCGGFIEAPRLNFLDGVVEPLLFEVIVFAVKPIQGAEEEVIQKLVHRHVPAKDLVDVVHREPDLFALRLGVQD